MAAAAAETVPFAAVAARCRRRRQSQDEGKIMPHLSNWGSLGRTSVCGPASGRTGARAFRAHAREREPRRGTNGCGRVVVVVVVFVGPELKLGDILC